MNASGRGRSTQLTSCVMMLAALLSACNYPGMTAPNTNSGVLELRRTLDAISKFETTEEEEIIRTLTPEAGVQVTNIAANGNVINNPMAISSCAGTTQRYFSQPGDTAAAIAARFEVEPMLLQSSVTLPDISLITPGTEIWIPAGAREKLIINPVLPDPEVINSPSVLAFDLGGFIDRQGGFLSKYTEWYQSEVADRNTNYFQGIC